MLRNVLFICVGLGFLAFAGNPSSFSLVFGELLPVLGVLILVFPAWHFIRKLLRGKKSVELLRASGFTFTTSFDLFGGCGIYFDHSARKLALVDGNEVLIASYDELPDLKIRSTSYNKSAKIISVACQISYIEKVTKYKRSAVFYDIELTTFNKLKHEWERIT